MAFTGFGKKKTGELAVSSPLSGKVVPIESVPDRAFSEKMMGDGVAIVPESGKVFSPVDGTVDTVADTFHAVGIHSDSGMDILIHIGLETVNLKGKYFTCHTAEGMKVRTGDLLIEFDLDGIRNAGYQLYTPVTLVNGEDFGEVTFSPDGTVAAGERLMLVKALSSEPLAGEASRRNRP